MSDLQIVFYFFFTLPLLLVAVPILLLVLWIVNRWILKGKIRLLYRILLSFAIPIALIGIGFAYIHYSYYRTSDMDKRLESIGVGITLPPYEITEFKNEHVMADDFRDTYQMVFKDASAMPMLRILDSVSNANSNWETKGDEYVFHSDNPEKEFLDTLIVRPRKGTATFIRYMW